MASRRELTRQRLKLFFASLQLRAIVALIGVVVAPLVFVWLSEPFEVTVTYRMQRDLERALSESSRALATGELPASRLAPIAERYGVRLRVFDSSTAELVLDEDHSIDQTLVSQYATLGLTATQRARLERYDEFLGPLIARRSVLDTLVERERSGSCELSDDKILMVCDLAMIGQIAPGREAVIHAQALTPRAISSLYESRYQLLKLALQVSIIAVLMGVWLGWRIIRPVNHLREQVVERTIAPVSTEPVDVPPKRDEVAQLAGAFNELLFAIEDSRQVNASFMADVAHEIKNPIAAVRACAESLGRGQPVDEKRAARMARALKTSSERMDALISRFLELARAEAGLPGEQRDMVRIDRLVEGVLDSLSVDERYQRVDFQLESEPAVVLAASVHIESVARNLIDNAASLVGEGGWVKIVITSLRGDVVLTVEDNGPGIKPEDLPKIFDRFFTRRADKTGTGLGLAMTRAIVNAHQGAITVRSELGEGTVFTVRLPLAPEPSTRGEPGAARS